MDTPKRPGQVVCRGVEGRTVGVTGTTEFRKLIVPDKGGGLYGDDTGVVLG